MSLKTDTEILTASGLVDPLKFSNLLKKAKNADARAEIIAEAVRESQEIMLSKKEAEERLATKSDIEKLKSSTKADIEKLRSSTKADIEKLRSSTKADIEKLRSETKTQIAETKISLLKWMITISFLQASLIIGIIKFL